jgi:cytochrome c5
MRLLSQAVLTVALLATLSAPAQTAADVRSAPHTRPKTSHSQDPARGQVVFERNCSRCHNPPQGFSTRISGTVAMHMRVRANLSDPDYKALVRFLNP